MKKVMISILIAVMLSLVPSVALASDPPDTNVDVTVVAPGDVGFNADVNAGGEVDFSIDGVGLQDALNAAVMSGRGGGDEYTYHLVRQNEERIDILWKAVGNDMAHDVAAIADAVSRNINADRKKQASIWLLASNVKSQDTMLFALDNRVGHLEVTGVQLSNAHNELSQYTVNEVSRLSYQNSTQDYQLGQLWIAVLGITGTLIIIIIIFSILVSRLVRKIKYLI